MQSSLSKLKRELRSYSKRKKARTHSRFFKTGKGEYGEGDLFLGVNVPNCRKVAKQFNNLSLDKTIKLLHSKYHEERLVALLILVEKFNKSNSEGQKQIYNLYLKNTKYINNWDLVDLSSSKIVGAYLFGKNDQILNKLARSKSLWERRISIIATLYYTYNSSFDKTLEVSEILLTDEHDLIHKAVGWMLREVGKKDQKTEEKFLKRHYKQMPRTMLRYAIERFPENLRQKYLKGEI